MCSSLFGLRRSPWVSISGRRIFGQNDAARPSFRYGSKLALERLRITGPSAERFAAASHSCGRRVDSTVLPDALPKEAFVNFSFPAVTSRLQAVSRVVTLSAAAPPAARTRGPMNPEIVLWSCLVLILRCRRPDQPGRNPQSTWRVSRCLPKRGATPTRRLSETIIRMSASPGRLRECRAARLGKLR